MQVLARGGLLRVPRVVRLLLFFPLLIFWIILITTGLWLRSISLILLVGIRSIKIQILVKTLPQSSRRGLAIARTIIGVPLIGAIYVLGRR